MGRTTNYKINIETDFSGATFHFWCWNDDKPYSGSLCGFAVEETNFQSLILPFIHKTIDWYDENEFTYQEIENMLSEIEDAISQSKIESEILNSKNEFWNSDGEWYYLREIPSEDKEDFMKCVYDFYESFIKATRQLIEDNKESNKFIIDGI